MYVSVFSALVLSLSNCCCILLLLWNNYEDENTGVFFTEFKVYWAGSVFIWMIKTENGSDSALGVEARSLILKGCESVWEKVKWENWNDWKSKNTLS